MFRKFLIPLLLIVSASCWAQSCKVFTDSGVTYYGLTTSQAYTVIDTFYSHKSLWQFTHDLQAHDDSVSKKLSIALGEIGTLKKEVVESKEALFTSQQETAERSEQLKDCQKIVSNLNWKVFGMSISNTLQKVVIGAGCGFLGFEVCKYGVVK